MSEPTPGVRCRHGHRITLPWVFCYQCKPRPGTFGPDRVGNPDLTPPFLDAAAKTATARSERAQRRRAADPEFMAGLRAQKAAMEAKSPDDRMSVAQLLERFPDMRPPDDNDPRPE